MSNIIDCRPIKKGIIEEIKEKKLVKPNTYAVFIQVGNDYASNIYVGKKKALCEELGINCHVDKVCEDITEQRLITKIKSYNKMQYVDAIMVQLPLPRHINEDNIINAIDPKKDLDGFNVINKGKLVNGDKDAMIPCTPKAILNIMKAIGCDFKGTRVCIAGRSSTVGKPLAHLLTNYGCTVTTCNSNTPDYVLKQQIAQSQIFVSAIGKGEYFNAAFFENYNVGNTIAIDVGINRSKDGKLCGDISRDMYDKFRAITPVPNGVGVMTVVEVIKNIMICRGNEEKVIAKTKPMRVEDIIITPEQVDTALRNFVSKQKLRNRVLDGVPVEVAIQTEIPRKLKANGVFTREQLEIARKNGISDPLLYYRRHKGWGIDKTINTPVNTKFSSKKKRENMDKLIK